jgi:hypothetical protein
MAMNSNKFDSFIREKTRLRWWDEQGNLLLTGDERAEQAEQENARLRKRVRALGVDPDSV